MDLNQTPSANRTHIAFFGMRNAGKSSLMNAVTGQNIAVVSEIKGTTTDPVLKSMELLPLGPVTVIDTAGLDDSGTLGRLRTEKTMQILRKTDIAVLVINAMYGMTSFDEEILNQINEQQIPYVLAYNKIDLKPDLKQQLSADERTVFVSAATGEGINELKEKLAHFAKTKQEKFILKDIIAPKDTVVLVIQQPS